MVNTNNGNGFKPGTPKPPRSGRAKGTPNKKTQKLIEIMDALKYDPFEALHALLPALDEKDQAQVHMKLMEYKYPKRRAEDATGDAGDGTVFAPVSLTDAQFAEAIRIARGEK